MEKQPHCECEVIHEDIVHAVKPRLLSDDVYISLATLFKLFGDSTRVRILHALEGTTDWFQRLYIVTLLI